MSSALLEIQNLTIQLSSAAGTLRPVEDVSLSVAAGQTHALVGESGSGKTLTALAVPQLLPLAIATIPSGRILLEGRDLLDLPVRALRPIRGKQIGMVFQEPLTSLNPVQTIGRQLREALTVHGASPSGVAELLARVGLEARVAQQFPHELSGGMRQRVLIAQAIAHRPRLLIADEPTTALDHELQAQILELLRTLQAELGMGILLITHDFRVAQAADVISVMYAGQLVESGPANAVLEHPEHPYTRALLASLPSQAARGRALPMLAGSVPEPGSIPRGCRFAPRCPERFVGCEEQAPALQTRAGGRSVRCRLFSEEKPHE